MEPDRKRPEMNDEMPPIDDELREAMEDIDVRQRKCLGLQKLLALLGMVCFGNVVGAGSLFANIGVAIFWGTHLASKGEKLAHKAYPWLHNIPFLCGPSGGKGYNGITAGTRVAAEAKKNGDELTARLLKFRGQSMLWSFIGMLGYIIALILFGRFVRWK